jgi:hypothetical protein
MAKTNDRPVWQSRRPISRLSHVMLIRPVRKSSERPEVCCGSQGSFDQLPLLADRAPKYKYCAGAATERNDGSFFMLLLQANYRSGNSSCPSPDLFICDICVDACVDTLATKIMVGESVKLIIS